MKRIKNSRYLGDGVYASWDGYHIWIWTSDGINISQRIALFDFVMAELEEFAERCFMGDVSIEEIEDE